jgi:tetratricopeptide (TPR) repeat protein
MARFLRKVVGKTCNQEDCTQQGQSVDLSQAVCEECSRPLFEVTMPDRARQAAALGLALLLAGGVAVGLMAASRLLLVNRSAVLALTVERQLAALARQVYKDGTASPARLQAIPRFLASQHIAPAAYASFEKTRLPHIVAANRRLRSGQTLIGQKLFEHARQEFLAATREDPESSIAWADLGGADVLTGRLEEAGEDYRRALSLDSDSWLAHYNFGLLLARRHAKAEALDHLQRAIDLLQRDGTVDRRSVIEDLRTNPVLDELRREPRFARLLA